MTPRLRKLRARARALLRQWDRALVRALRVACAQRPVPERLARRWQRRYERADAAWRAARDHAAMLRGFTSTVPNERGQGAAR